MQLEFKIWRDSQLLLCSPTPQSRRAASLYGSITNSFLYCLCFKRSEHSFDTPALVLFTSYCPIAFTIFLFDIYHISHIMASSGKPSGPGHLANDPYLCDVCGRGFPTKEEYDTHRLQH